MNDTYLLGRLSAKVSQLMTIEDFKLLNQMTKQKQLEYLFDSGFINEKASSIEVACQKALEKLDDEILDYVGCENPIYKYFFDKESQKTTLLNHIYEQQIDKQNTLFEVINDIHAVGNLNLVYRISFIGAQKDVFNKYYLNQNIIAKSKFIEAFDEGRSAIIQLIKENTNIDIAHDDDSDMVEKKLEIFLNDKLKFYGYQTDIEALLIVYVWFKKVEIKKVRFIYYFNEVK